MSEEGFDLAALSRLIVARDFRRVALQFPDENIAHCIVCYETLRAQLPQTVDLFIITDSTFGSSVDDISASHVSADALVFFGDDTASSGSMPIIVLPYRRHIDLHVCSRSLLQYFANSPCSRKVILCVDPSYIHMASSLAQMLQQTLAIEVIEAKHRSSIELDRNLERDLGDSDVEFFSLGGQLVPKSLLDYPFEVVYVGASHHRLTAILLRVPEMKVVQYNPETNGVVSFHGKDSRTFHERYGGISRVEQSNIIGIIVGSMGLRTEVTRAIVLRLQTLVRAAGKAFYTFIMGRLSESKLCNFPEIDVFCLIASEDNAFIKPKTFPVPVITPYELEVGLGCREWSSMYELSVDAILKDDISEALSRIKERKAFSVSDSGPVGGSESATALDDYKSRELTTFTSAALDRFSARGYKGLEYDDADRDNVAIQPGLHGTASSYKRNT